MEGMGHVQDRSRSSLADNPRCPTQDRRCDRSKPVTLHVLTRTRMRLLCYDPGDSFAYSPSAAGSRCKEPFDAETNPHERANTTCRQAGWLNEDRARRLAAIGRRGLHREAPRRTYNRPRAGSFCLFEFTGLFRCIQAVIWTPAPSLSRSETDRASQSTAHELGVFDN